MRPIIWRGRRCERPLTWLEAAESVVSGRSAPAAKCGWRSGSVVALEEHGWCVLCPQANFAFL